MAEEALLQVVGLTTYFFTFGRTRIVKAVDNVSFEVKSGDRLALIGESGCGKSTLARVLMRLEDPTAGEIDLDGVDFLALKGRELRRMRRRVPDRRAAGGGVEARGTHRGHDVPLLRRGLPD